MWTSRIRIICPRWTRTSSQTNGFYDTAQDPTRPRKSRYVPTPWCGGIERTVYTVDDPTRTCDTALAQFAPVKRRVDSETTVRGGRRNRPRLDVRGGVGPCCCCDHRCVASSVRHCGVGEYRLVIIVSMSSSALKAGYPPSSRPTICYVELTPSHVLVACTAHTHH